MKHTSIFATIGILFASTFASQADELPLYTTGSFAFTVSEITGDAIAVKTSGAKVLTCLLGESVSMTAPDGATSTIPAVDGVCSWTPSAGGTWAFSNSVEGDAVFTVRYSLFPGTQGTGTVSDPVKLVDDDELTDLFTGGVMAEGSAFTLCGAHGIGSLAIPSGYAADGAADGVWRLVAASGGLLYGSLPAVGIVDSTKPGPNRSVRDPKLMPPFAYSGDGWAGSDTAASTLTFRSPAGVAADEVALNGWGTFAYQLSEVGKWSVTLEMEDGTMLTSDINCLSGLTIIFW